MSDHPHDLDSLARENEALRRAVRTLHGVANLVRASQEQEPTCYALLTGVTAGVGLGLNRAMLFMVDGADRGRLRGVAAVGPADADDADQVWRSIARDAPDLQALYEAGLRQRAEPGQLDRRVRATRVPIEAGSPIALAMRRVELVCAEGSDDLDGLLHLPTAVAAPLRADDRVQGVLYADNRFTGHRLDPVSELVFALIADHAGRAISQAREFDQLAEQARTDSLTGLGHHGAMMGAVAAEVAAAAAREGRVGLVMIDLDDFKLVNDRHGHLVGDALLAAVARRLGTAIRGTGTAFRYGGEEFAVLVGEVDAGALAEVGERLRRTIGERPFVVGTGPAVPITASVGVALCEGAQGSVKGLIGAADGALLAAKAAGKNRVVTGGGARDPRVIGG